MFYPSFSPSLQKQKLDSQASPPARPPFSTGVQVLPPASRRPLHPAPSRPLPTQSLPTPLPLATPTREDVRALLAERKEQYAAAMKEAKAQGAVTKSQEFGKIAVTFSRIVKAFDQGREVDLSQMPGPPPGFRSKYRFDISKYKAQPQPQPPPQGGAVVKETPQGVAPVTSQPDGGEADSSIPIPKTVMEALEQRLTKYRDTQRLAEEKGESSRVRRMGRIVKQYEEAIKATKAKKPYNYSELPDPPGYPPIPVPRAPVPAPSRSPQASLASVGAIGPTQSLPPPRAAGGMATGSKFMPNPSISQDQMQLLTQRQKELLRAVKEAKQREDKEKALHYLRLYKGLEKMVEAARGGLPVDLTQVPPSPYADISKTKPSAAVLSHLKPASEGDEKTFERIKSQLQKQIKICEDNSKTYEEIGNVGTATQYQNMAQELQKELLAIEGIQSQGLCPPKFTMETRKFTIVHTHSDLSSHQCEVEVVGAVSLPKPQGYEEKDLNVYVEVEFPWPTDNPPKPCSDSVKETANPEFKYKVSRDCSRGVSEVSGS